MPSNPPSIAPARLLLLALAYTLLVLVILLNIRSIEPALGQLLDFGSFLAAGHEAAAGRDPYAGDATLVYQIESQETGQTLPSPNLNPPLSVILFQPLAGTEPAKAVSLWRALSALLYTVGVLILAWQYRAWTTPLRILWAFALAAFWNTIALGQIYAPIFALTVGAWIFLEKRRMILAGILIGAIVAIKPNFVFWLILLGLSGFGIAVLSAILTALALSLLPVLVFGLQIYRQWISTLLEYPSLGLTIAGNSSLQSLARRAGIENLGIALAILLAVIAGYLVYRYRISLSMGTINTLGIAGSILVSPFSWAGYAILILPAFYSLQRWNGAVTLAAACLAFPYVLVLYLFRNSAFHSIVFGWIYGWGLVLLLVGIALDRRQSHASTLQGSL